MRKKLNKKIFAISIFTAFLFCGVDYFINNNDSVDISVKKNIIQDHSIEVENQQLLEESLKEINMLKYFIKVLYGSRLTYKGLSIELALMARVVPDSMHIKGVKNKLTNVFGGITDVYEVVNEKNNQSSFQIKYTGIPKKLCVDLVDSLSKSFNKVEIEVEDKKIEIFNSLTSKENEINLIDKKIKDACSNDLNNLLLTSL